MVSRYNLRGKHVGSKKRRYVCLHRENQARKKRLERMCNRTECASSRKQSALPIQNVVMLVAAQTERR